MNKFALNHGGGASRSLKAFTLAEVLITLAIIGVVAALTIPTLITKYQKQQYVTQLKKTVSVLNNGFRNIMASEGVLNLANTSLWAKAPDEYVTGNNYSEFAQEFAKHFKVLEVQANSSIMGEMNYKRLNGKTWESAGAYGVSYFHFADGSTIYVQAYKPIQSTVPVDEIKKQGGKFYERLGVIFVDTNGDQGPNMLGRDLFQFMIGQDGNLYPAGGKDTMYYTGLDYYNWDNSNKVYGCKTDGDFFGQGCAGRIIEEGWQMNY